MTMCAKDKKTKKVCTSCKIEAYIAAGESGAAELGGGPGGVEEASSGRVNRRMIFDPAGASREILTVA